MNGTVVPHTQVGIAASSAVWRAVFSPRTPVAPHRFVDFSEYAAAADGVVGLLRADPGALPRRWPGCTRTARPRGDELRRAGHGRRAEPRAGERRRTTAWPRRPRTGRRWTIAVDVDEPCDVAGLRLPRLGQPARPPPGAAPASRPGRGPRGQPACRPTRPGQRHHRLRRRPGAPRSSWSPGPPPTSWPCPTRTPDHNEQAGGFLRLAAEKAFLSIVDPHLAASRVTAAADSVVDRGLRGAAGPGHPGAEPGPSGPDQDLRATGPIARPSWRSSCRTTSTAAGRRWCCSRRT